MNSNLTVAVAATYLKVTLRYIIEKYETDKALPNWLIEDAKEQLAKADTALTEWTKEKTLESAA